jgi:hypothetical protein
MMQYNNIKIMVSYSCVVEGIVPDYVAEHSRRSASVI